MWDLIIFVMHHFLVREREIEAAVVLSHLC